MAPKNLLRKILTPFVVVAAFLYFLLDLLFGLVLRPVNRWLARLRVFEKIRKVIEGFGPYTTLTLFLVPLIVLEPAKIVGLLLVALGHPVSGTVMVVVGECLKILIVERIFQIGRPKLMLIPAFAWTYNYVVGWLSWLAATPAWMAVRRRFRLIVHWSRSLLRRSRHLVAGDPQ